MMERHGKTQLSAWLLVVSVCAVSVFTMWPTWLALIERWFTMNRYSHGPLIVAIVAYLIFDRRNFLRTSSIAPEAASLVPLALLLSVWGIAVLASVQAIQVVLLPLILWTALYAVLGWKIARSLILPCAYLYLAIPIWESGNFVLQWMTVQVVGVALSVLQIPAYIEGNLVSLPAGSFSVDGGCTGLHYLVIAIALSVLYATLWIRSWPNRVIIIAIAIAMALMTNWLRVFTVVYAGHVTDMQHYLVTHNHYYFGWVLFSIALVPYLLFARRVERLESKDQNSSKSLVEPGPTSSTVRYVLPVCIALFVASSVMIYAKMNSKIDTHVELQLPPPDADWNRVEALVSQSRPYYVGATAELFADYESSGGSVSVYRNIYQGQSQGRELIGYENRVEGQGRWTIAVSKISTVQFGSSGSVRSVREIEIVGHHDRRRLMYLWYDVGGQHLVKDLSAKMWFGLNLLRNRHDAGVTVVSASCTAGCSSARGLLNEWLSAHMQENGVS